MLLRPWRRSAHTWSSMSHNVKFLSCSRYLQCLQYRTVRSTEFRSLSAKQNHLFCENHSCVHVLHAILLEYCVAAWLSDLLGEADAVLDCWPGLNALCAAAIAAALLAAFNSWICAVALQNSLFQVDFCKCLPILTSVRK